MSLGYESAWEPGLTRTRSKSMAGAHIRTQTAFRTACPVSKASGPCGQWRMYRNPGIRAAALKLLAPAPAVMLELKDAIAF